MLCCSWRVSTTLCCCRVRSSLSDHKVTRRRTIDERGRTSEIVRLPLSGDEDDEDEKEKFIEKMKNVVERQKMKQEFSFGSWNLRHLKHNHSIWVGERWIRIEIMMIEARRQNLDKNYFFISFSRPLLIFFLRSRYILHFLKRERKAFSGFEFLHERQSFDIENDSIWWWMTAFELGPFSRLVAEGFDISIWENLSSLRKFGVRSHYHQVNFFYVWLFASS